MIACGREEILAVYISPVPFERQRLQVQILVRSRISSLKYKNKKLARELVGSIEIEEFTSNYLTVLGGRWLGT